jgi:endonuclease/exonuclease/phosphatase family metal-dependent hydrolase
MRLATFNVENMFERPSVMNLPSWEDGNNVLKDFDDLIKLARDKAYSEQTKKEMLKIMKQNIGLLTKGESKFIRLVEVREKLVKKQQGVYVIIANGRDDWIGWFELRKDTIKELAIENTARVINELKADVLCVVEAENRIALKRFNEMMIPKVNGQPYDHIMLIDGNDERGIDVGITTRKSFAIKSMVSHIDDTDQDGLIFSRDCAEYHVSTSSGNDLVLLINHFKSKGYGAQQDNDKKRGRQAKKVRDIYDELNKKFDFIAVIGDLNDTPDSAPLSQLTGNGSNLSDIMKHENFVDDGRPGTHGNGTKSGKLDYILMSPELAKKVKQGGIERRGVWGGKNGDLFPHFPEIKTVKDAASDHAALWVDVDV